jgi:hypothetical protein
MSVKDSTFVKYLDRVDNNNMIFTIQDKCNKFIGQDIVTAHFTQLTREREAVFLSYFRKKGVENRVKIAKSESTIPYNGFSFYKIVYKGEFPEDLLKAYHKMNGFNREAPRKKYQKKREKNKHV